MSNEGDVLEALASRFDAKGFGKYRAAGDYTADETAIVFFDMPDFPDRVICLSAWTMAQQPVQSQDRIKLQVRCRGTRNDVLDVLSVRGPIFDDLQGLTDVMFGSVHAIQILQRSALPLPTDANDRKEHSDNYDIDADVPATANRPE